MWNRVEQVVDDLRPLVRSVGIDLKVVDVLDRVVTVELVRDDEDARPDLVRLRDFVAREIQAEIADVTDVVFVGDLAPPEPRPAGAGPEIEISTPEADADTVVISLDRTVAPGATTVFDDVASTGDWPLVRAVLSLQGVVSVIGREKRLIVARANGISWDALIPQIEEALSTPVSGDLRSRVQAVLDERVNPSVASHGGVIELLDLRGTELFIHMGGGCQGCAMSTATLKQGVETMIREHVPEITAIYDTTDHAAGENPFYRA